MNWIKAKDEVPSDERDVLVSCVDSYAIGYYNENNKSFWNYEIQEYDGSVTHWMDIKSPKG